MEFLEGEDPTQGPACALTAAAATVYRNYFVGVGLGAVLAEDLGGHAKEGHRVREEARDYRAMNTPRRSSVREMAETAFGFSRIEVARNW